MFVRTTRSRSHFFEAHRKLRGPTLISLSLMSLSAAAQPGPTLTRGSFTLDASMGIEYTDADNVFQSSENVQSSRISILTPTLLMSSEPGDHRFELAYAGEIAEYSLFSADDYSDHNLAAGAFLALGARSALDIVTSREKEHEDRGTGLTEGFDFIDSPTVLEPDKYEADDTMLRFRFGTPESRMNFAVEVGERETEYTNNLERTQLFDRINSSAELIVGYAVAPGTALEFIARSADIEYDQERGAGAILDSKENTYMLGVRWEASGRTTGSVRFGQLDKEYDDDTRIEFSASNWEVEVTWSPRTYSHVEFLTERFPSESTFIVGDVVDNERYQISWLHEWTSVIETAILWQTTDQEFRSETAGRVQDYSLFSLEVRYAMRDWLVWEAGIDRMDRQSNLDQFNFDGTVVRVGARILF